MLNHMSNQDIFAYAGSAWTPQAYQYDTKAMHSLSRLDLGSEIPKITFWSAIKVASHSVYPSVTGPKIRLEKIHISESIKIPTTV